MLTDDGSVKEVQIRLATADDAEPLARLHVDAWEEAYTHLLPHDLFVQRRATLPDRIQRWRQQLTEAPPRTTVAEHTSGLIGFLHVGPARVDDVNVPEELRALYVRATWWGTGVGHELLTAALAERPAYLWVLQGNHRAIAFYRKHRFVEDGATRTDEYGTERRMTRQA